MPDDPVLSLLARLAEAGHPARLDPARRGGLLVADGANLPEGLKAELLASKPAILAHLAGEEVARQGGPFHEGAETPPVVLESYWGMPDGSLMPDGTMRALLDLRRLLAGREKSRGQGKARRPEASLDWGAGGDG